MDPVTLIETIPARETFEYSHRNQKAIFGCNGKILPNISPHLENLEFISSLGDRFIIFDRMSQVRNQRKIEVFVSDVNDQNGTTEQLLEWVSNNWIDYLSEIEPLNEISNIILNANLGVTCPAHYPFLSVCSCIVSTHKIKQNSKKLRSTAVIS